MKEAYQRCVKVCPIWKDIHAAQEKSRKSRKYRNEFLYVQNLNKQWRLVLPGTFNTEDKNFLEIAIVKAHVATAHGGIGNTMKALAEKFKSQSFCRLVKEFVRSCDIC